VGAGEEQLLEGVPPLDLRELGDRGGGVARLQLQVPGEVVPGRQVLLRRLAAVVDHLLDLLGLGPGLLVLPHLREDAAAPVAEPAQPELLLVVGQAAARHALVALLVRLHGRVEPAVLEVDAGDRVPDEDLGEALRRPGAPLYSAR
jgi:hypothetical protein